MLKTRLWMGAVLIVLTIGMLVGDQHFAPYFPFLFVFQFALTLMACHELVNLLGAERVPQKAVCYLGVAIFVLANWFLHYAAPSPPAPLPQGERGDMHHAPFWLLLIAILAGFLLITFLYEMATFTA